MTSALLISNLREKYARGERLATLTCYDYPSARLMDGMELDLLLVGDSLGMVVLGFPDTTHVTMEHMLHHVEAVARGAKKTLVVADLPYESYATPDMTVRNARRLLAAGAHAVKLEGGQDVSAQLAALQTIGIPVLGHVGMLPQHILIEKGYKKKGKRPGEAEIVLADALAVEAAGAFAVVVESVTPSVARDVTTALRIPTIGIGANGECSGEILVLHDLIGFFPWFCPPFAKQEGDVAGEIRQAVEKYRAFVKNLAKP